MMCFSQRRSSLLRVLEIESKINDIEHSNEYLKLKRGVRVLENRNSEGSIVTVASLDDLNEVVEIRRNSADSADYLRRYKNKMQAISDRIDFLNIEKSQLTKDLKKTP